MYNNHVIDTRKHTQGQSSRVIQNFEIITEYRNTYIQKYRCVEEKVGI